ncbi:hypothetical protein [Pseudophaeobacter sp.]|uniref:hypothetical protein n=1 Tax=Pseudophaeobacter sp. TaxID=1971739 RepID=UPI00405A3140
MDTEGNGVKTTKNFCRAILSFSLAGFCSLQPALASDECNIRRIADIVKTISILRQVENSLNTLALAQTDAIIDIATGVHTLELYNDESGFFGPLGGLRKTTDKNETVLNNLDKSIRRLTTFPTVERRYEDLREDSAAIIGAGYEILGLLEAEDPQGATRVYASTTVVVLNQARADSYTVMSELERPISLAGFRCK